MPASATRWSVIARVRISYRDIHGNTQTEESQGLRAVCLSTRSISLNGLFWIKRCPASIRER